MANRKSKTRIEAENERARFAATIRSVTTLVSLLIKASAWVAIAWIGLQMVREVAGRETDVSVIISAAVSLGKLKWLPWMVTAIAAAWAMVERWFRKRKVRTLASRVISLEKRLDRNRSSSRLTSSGDTNPSDE